MKPCKITVDLYNTFRERMPEYVQYDRNVPLEITILENGEPANLGGSFGRLLVLKPDGHEVYNNNVEINDNIITTILGDQVFTASGIAKITIDILNEQNSKRALIPFEMRIKSAVITDESIKSSNDYQTITALISDVRAIDAMFHVEQEQRDEAFNTQMESQDTAFTRMQRGFLEDHREMMSRMEQQIVEQADAFRTDQEERSEIFDQNEQERVTNEINRRMAENVRVAQEETRQKAEMQRVAVFEENENLRQEGEEVRVANDNERKKTFNNWENRESTRLESENTRISQERTRVSNELGRQAQEETRKAQEDHRQKTYTQFNDAEASRASEELKRQQAEVKREEAEVNRQNSYMDKENARDRLYIDAEDSRDSMFRQSEVDRQEKYDRAERERVASEQLRQTREQEREDAESQRQSAESNRDEIFMQGQNDRDRQYVEAEESRNNVFNQNEADRQNTYDQAERERIVSEELRKTNEQGRENAEAQRVGAETQRIENFNTAITNATNTMNQAVTNVNQAIEESNATMTAIENRADACIPIIEQSSTEIAQARVDYTGTTHDSLRQANDANVEYVLGEVNTMHYEGQTITAHDSLVGQAKNAIVEGVTLVNLRSNAEILKHNIVNFINNGSVLTWDTNGSWGKVGFAINGRPNATYCIKYTSKHDTLGFYLRNGKYLDGPTQTITKVNDFFRKFITDETGVFTISIEQGEATSDNFINDFIILEYQEGMENWDITYFEGMTSVKAPVIKSVGKNLTYPSLAKVGTMRGITVSYDDSTQEIIINGTCTDDNSSWGFNSPILKVKKGEKYYAKLILTSGQGDKIAFRWSDAKWVNSIYIYSTLTHPAEMDCVHTVAIDNKYMNRGIRIDAGATFVNARYKVMVSKEPITEYEPHKTHSIATPNDLNLRGINNVKDTLDITKGEKVERIVERILNGSEDWQRESNFEHDTLLEFRLNLQTEIKDLITDKFAIGGKEERAAFLENGGLYIRILKTKLSSETLEGFKEWLANNNLTIQYVLAEPIIKKVELSDNRVYSYQDTTHYSFEVFDNSLIPTLSLDVPTKLPAIVSRQSTTINQLENENKSLKNENKALKTEIKETSTSSVNGDLELMSQQFDLDFRIFEIESTLDIPTQLNLKGAKTWQ